MKCVVYVWVVLSLSKKKKKLIRHFLKLFWREKKFFFVSYRRKTFFLETFINVECFLVKLISENCLQAIGMPLFSCFYCLLSVFGSFSFMFD